MSKDVLLGKEPMNEVIEGINLVANSVKVTLGPKGRNIILSKGNEAPLITNDGATIAKEINLKDPAKNTGAQVIKQASERTNNEAGDGTTTTALLAQSLINEGNKLIEEGIDPIDLRSGMNTACGIIVEELKKESKPIESNDDIKKIATISSGSELIGSLISEAYEAIGKEGAITVEESKSNVTSIEIKEGYRVPFAPNQYFFADPNGTFKSTIDIDNAAILVSASKIDSLPPFAPVLQEIANQGGKIVIFAESVAPQVLDAILANYFRGLQVYLVDLSNLPDKVDILTDIAITTGAKLFNVEKGVLYKDITLDDLGMAMKVKFKKDKETLLIDCQGELEEKEMRKEELRKGLNEDESLNEKQKDLIKRRISGLTKGIAVINLGSSSEIEMGELSLRVEDALCSVRSSLEEGIVPGAGSTFIKISPKLDVENKSDSFIKGVEIVKSAIQMPLSQILKNAQYSDERIKEIVEKVTKSGKVYNLVTDEYEDPETTNVFDPTKVERLSIETAVSVASTILTTSGIVMDEKETTGDIVLKALGVK